MLDLLLMIRTARSSSQRERPWVDTLNDHASPALGDWLQAHRVALPHRVTFPDRPPSMDLFGATWIAGGGRKAGEVLFIDAPLPEELTSDLTQAVLAQDAQRKRGVISIEVQRLNRPVAAYLSVTDPRLALPHPRGLYDLADTDLSPVATLYESARPATAPEVPRLRTGARTPSNLGRSRSR